MLGKEKGKIGLEEETAAWIGRSSSGHLLRP